MVWWWKCRAGRPRHGVQQKVERRRKKHETQREPRRRWCGSVHDLEWSGGGGGNERTGSQRIPESTRTTDSADGGVLAASTVGEWVGRGVVVGMKEEECEVRRR